jgi:predicted transcriptional regulator
MPNKRKAGKRALSTWVPEELKQELERLARSRGVPLSAVVEEILRDELDRETGKK